MSTSKYMNRICIIAVAAALVLTILFSNISPAIPAQAAALGYEDKLFDTSRVHTIDIIIDDWEGFLATAQSEEYCVCNVVIDGETFSTVGIRGKGNTSLSTVASMDSDRYSFKIEFDQYDSSQTYHGLDKLSLNNLIQDNTMMKDYLTYRMMNEFAVAAPLCSYVYITVNGEDWGLYLAVEAVEESFLQRSYGSGYGELYKPDSMDMGGGRGNGRDFRFEDFSEDVSQQTDPDASGGMQAGQMPPGGMGGQPGMQGAFPPSQMGGNGETGTQPAMPENFDPSRMEGMMPGGMDMGSSDTKLQYIDDDAGSYSSIFDNAKTNVTAADQQRLIASLKTLSEGTDPASVVAVEDVIRYFVVHNYVVNADSYTGSMVHNYYLYEDDGRLSMIPWDYNLAFGTFQGGDAAAMVSDDIDAPLSVTGSGRPMIDWIISSAEYTELYHTYFREFLDTVDADAIIAQAKSLIAPYVEKDPTKFCTYEEFEKGVETLRAFCSLRSRSVADQLAGGDGTVDASAITLSDMGTMNNNGNRGQMSSQPGTTPDASQQFPGADVPGGMTPPDGTEFSGQHTAPQRETANGAANSGSWLPAAIAIVILLGGLLFAFKFKR